MFFFKAPDFWYGTSVLSRFLSLLLTPFSWVYAAVVMLRYRLTPVQKIPVPVICVGNVVSGGAGKTPVVMALVRMVMGFGRTPHIVLRGYGGNQKGPLRVDADQHGYAEVGDEALLLARTAPTWIASDRVAGARAAVSAGADVVFLDDGFQNPHLHKDFSFVVVDAHTGFGNGCVLPAGPLREPLACALHRASAVIVIGDGLSDSTQKKITGNVVIKAAVQSDAKSEKFRGRKAVAFAGIGRPEKFRKTLESLGVEVVSWRSFADHKPYSAAEIWRMIDVANDQQALLLTTAKDYLRLPPDLRQYAEVVAISVAWEDEQKVLDTLKSVLT